MRASKTQFSTKTRVNKTQGSLCLNNQSHSLSHRKMNNSILKSSHRILKWMLAIAGGEVVIVEIQNKNKQRKK